MHNALPAPRGLHVAIIMDGNGRWAVQRGLPRPAGHRAGAAAVRRVVEAAPALGIGTLTLFAFSADNWRRPAAEVAALLGLLRGHLRGETPRLAAAGVRLQVIGRRDRLPARLCREIERAEAATAAAEKLHLRIAVDYSARDSIARAAALQAEGPADPEAFGRLVAQVSGGGTAGAVDLLIRTGGEQRLSDFLLWEAAYAELCFVERPWPDFAGIDLAAAIGEFHRRERRFGGLAAAVAE